MDPGAGQNFPLVLSTFFAAFFNSFCVLFYYKLVKKKKRLARTKIIADGSNSYSGQPMKGKKEEEN